MLAHAHGEIEKHKVNVNVYLENPAGIGDHSTSDFWNNANEALELLVSADDRLTALAKYFPEQDMAHQSTLF